MKKLWLALALFPLLAISPVARAQNTNGLFSGTAQTLTYIQSQYVLAPLPSATITVCNYPATQPSSLLPCTNLALLYSGPTTSTPAAAAFSADAQGNFSFWALPGYYTYTVTNILTNVTTGPYAVVLSPGSSSGTGGATFPFPGLVFATNSIAGTVATSSQIAIALNTSPSTRISPTVLPVATTISQGIVQPDGTSITINPTTGVISSSPPSVSIPATTLVLKGANLPNIAQAAQPGTDYVIPSGSILGSAGSLSGASTIPNGTVATTQTPGDSSLKLATDAFVLANAGATTPITSLVLKGSGLSNGVVAAIPNTDYTTPSGSIAGTAGNLSGTPALPNGVTATTQSPGDNTTKLATTAFVLANAGTATIPATSLVLKGSGSAGVSVAATPGTDYLIPGSVISSKVVNGVSYSQFYTGTTVDVRVNACLGDAISLGNGNTTGICDASAESGTKVTAATITVGNSSGNPVTLLLPTQGQWRGGMTDGTSATINQFGNTAIIGKGGESGIGSQFVIGATATSNLGYVFLLTPLVSQLNYIYDSNFSIVNVNGGPYVGHITANSIGAKFQGPIYDSSTLDHVVVFDALDAKSAVFDQWCCGGVARNISVNGNYGTGVTPLTITNTSAFNLDTLSVVHPGAGQPLISISDSSSHTSNLNIESLYMEGSNSDTTTNWIHNDGYGSIFIGKLAAKAEVTSSTATILTSTSTTNTGIFVGAFTAVNGTGNFTFPVTVVNNSSTGQVVTSDSTTAKGNLGLYLSNALWASSATIPTITTTALTASGATNLNSTVVVGASTAATSGANQTSPQLRLTGNYWTGSASATDNFLLTNTLGTGTNPTATLTLAHTGSSGLASVSFPFATTVSSLTTAGTVSAGLLSSSAASITAATIGSLTVSGSATVGTGLTATSDGTHAGLLALAGNTTAPTIPPNEFAWLGFNSTSATAYGFQPSTTAPVTGQYMAVATPSSGVSQVTYSTPPGSVVATPTPLTAQAANVSFVTIYTTPAANHYYQVCGEANQTQVATVSSTMVQIQIGYTSAIDNVIKVANIGTSPGLVANTTVQDNSGCAVLFVKASTTIQWQTVGYVSAGATPMQYSLSGTVQLIQ